jgi:rhodanese-related sulfurtransferase
MLMNKLDTLLAVILLAGASAVPAAEPASPPAPAATPAAAPVSETPLISQADLLARLEKKDPTLVVLDVRTPAEFAAGHVPGAVNVAHDQVPAKLAELAAHKDKDVVLYCRSGRRSAAAANTLRGAGFGKLLHLEGDWLAWEAEKKPVERPAEPR